VLRSDRRHCLFADSEARPVLPMTDDTLISWDD
jgi:hypothetical protein